MKFQSVNHKHRTIGNKLVPYTKVWLENKPMWLVFATEKYFPTVVFDREVGSFADNFFAENRDPRVLKEVALDLLKNKTYGEGITENQIIKHYDELISSYNPIKHISESMESSFLTIQEKGIDPIFLERAKKLYLDTKDQLISIIKTNISPIGEPVTHVPIELLATILQVTDGNLKGTNVLDLGSGDGNKYVPLLSTILSDLGANVTGVDMYELPVSLRNRCKFKSVGLDLAKTYAYGDLESIAKDSDIIIANSLLHEGFKAPECGPYHTVNTAFGDGKELEFYNYMLRSVRNMSDNDPVVFAQTPFANGMGSKDLRQHVGSLVRYKLVGEKVLLDNIKIDAETGLQRLASVLTNSRAYEEMPNLVLFAYK